MTKGKGNSRRIILLGLDGATWKVIDALIGQGRLPHFQTLLQQGVRADLHSLEVPASPRVWTSIASGKSEGKHGIMDFFSTISQLRVKRLWDIFNESGYSASILYWFLTWPPKKDFNGHMVPGFLARDTRTVPQELSFLKELEMSEKYELYEGGRKRAFLKNIRRVRNALRFGVKPSTLFYAASFKLNQWVKTNPDLEIFPQVQLLKLYLYRDVFMYLLKNDPKDLHAIIFPQPDQISHKYWAFYEPDEYEKRLGIPVTEQQRKQFGDIIPQVYQEIDQVIGLVQKALRSEDVLIVVSDHGFGMIKETRAQLKIKGEAFIEALGLQSIVHGVSIGPYFVIQIDRENYRNEIAAFAEKMKSIHLEDEEAPFFEVTVKGSEIMLGLRKIWLIRRKDAQHLFRKSLLIGEKRVPVKDIVVWRSDITGDHEPDGIFIMSGKGIRQNFRLPKVSVLDITPTILYLKGLPIAQDMDGQPLLAAFTEEYRAANPLKYIDSYETGEPLPYDEQASSDISEDLHRRLQNLGYLG